jgi:sigma-B regulation protein RsbU (phosphoserine phosphatase)
MEKPRVETQHGRLLVVESDKAKRDALARHIEQLGCLVASAKDGHQAWDMLAQGEVEGSQAQMFDLVLLGVGTSEMDGRQLLERLKADPRLCHIPVIVTSTVDEVDKVAKCVELGAEDYLFEPFNPLLLKARIGACVEKKQLRDQVRAHSGLLKLERDLQIGRQIQADFLPDEDKLPQPAGWGIATRFHPAREVAGDFYDVFLLTGDKVGLVIADVCDKGVGAALFMALSRSLIRAFAEQHRPLGWMDSLTSTRSAAASDKVAKRRRMLLSAGTGALLAVKLTNDYIADNHGDMNMFATLFFGVLDPATGVLTYVNGGHDPPAIVGLDGVVKTRLEPTGPAVGMLPNMDFDIQQITLEPGDLLMAFSDGVPDARNPEGERFTLERLWLLLEQSAPSVTALLDRIEAALRAHIADVDQYDDITMLAVQRVTVSGT